MRQRLIAILILLFMIGLPVLGYWFFFVKNISGIQIFVGSGVTADVKLSGTFSYNWLPLADRALRFEQKCETSCVFEPIAPAQYTVEITADNFAKISENFTLKNGERIVKNFALTKTATLETIELPTEISDNAKKLRNDDVKADFGADFSVIGTDIRGVMWVVKIENATSKIGIIRDNRFVEVTSFPYVFSDLKLDFYGDIFVFSHNSGVVLVTLDGQKTLETTLPDNTIFTTFSEGEWYVITAEKTFLYKNNIWQENPRFSLFADLGEWRAGYISKNSQNLLEIGNYSPSEWSVLVLLNRQNGEIYQIARGLEISKIFSYNGQLIFENSWKFYSIKIPE